MELQLDSEIPWMFTGRSSEFIEKLSAGQRSPPPPTTEEEMEEFTRLVPEQEEGENLSFVNCRCFCDSWSWHSYIHCHFQTHVAASFVNVLLVTVRSILPRFTREVPLQKESPTKLLESVNTKEEALPKEKVVEKTAPLLKNYVKTVNWSERPLSSTSADRQAHKYLKIRHEPQKDLDPLSTFMMLRSQLLLPDAALPQDSANAAGTLCTSEKSKFSTYFSVFYTHFCTLLVLAKKKTPKLSQHKAWVGISFHLTSLHGLDIEGMKKYSSLYFQRSSTH